MRNGQYLINHLPEMRHLPGLPHILRLQSIAQALTAALANIDRFTIPVSWAKGDDGSSAHVCDVTVYMQTLGTGATGATGPIN